MEIQDQLTETLARYSTSEKTRLKLQTQVDTMTTDLEKTKKRADEATKHEKQLEKELEEYKTKLSIANAEIDTAFQASRNHALELSKYKHLNEQMSEQLELVQKDKRRISGKSAWPHSRHDLKTPE